MPDRDHEGAPVGPHTVLVAARDQVSCALGEEAAILHLTSGTYYGLNPVGARAWALLQDPIPVERLHATLLAEYDVAPDRLERDLLDLLRALLAENLIEVRGEPAA